MGDLKERIAVLETKVDSVNGRVVGIESQVAGVSAKIDLAFIERESLRSLVEKNGRWTKRDLAIIAALSSLGGGSGGVVFKALTAFFGGG